MAGKIKEGQSVYIPFVDGESALDSHFSTRVYSSPSQFRKNYRGGDSPTLVEYAPVVHGQWLIEEYEFFTCSVCGGGYYSGAESTAQAESYLNSGFTYRYCPNCGAKMDGGQHETD